VLCKVFKNILHLPITVSDCPQHNSKTNDPIVFKLGMGMTLGYPRNDVVFGVERSKVKVTGSKSVLMARFRRSAGGMLLSERIWSSHLLRGRP